MEILRLQAGREGSHGIKKPILDKIKDELTTRGATLFCGKSARFPGFHQTPDN